MILKFLLYVIFYLRKILSNELDIKHKLKIKNSFLNLSDKTIDTKPLNTIFNHISSKIMIMGGIKFG